MLNLPNVKNNLERYIKARFPILYINTFEETKADGYIQGIAKRLPFNEVLEWNGAKGLVNFQTKAPLIPDQSLETALKSQARDKQMHRKILVIKDADEYLTNDPANQNTEIVALLKEIARKICNGEIMATMIIVSSSLHIPKTLESLITVLKLDLPDEEEIRDIIKRRAGEVHDKLLEEMAIAFKGLSEFAINDLINLSLSENSNELTNKALPLIHEQKKQMIMKSGILEMVEVKETIDSVGGLEILKKWLVKKEKVFKNPKKAEEFDVAIPKGVLIAGMPGCGKSLTAKAAGMLFNVPLLKLDMGRLMGKYVGESEENMRRAIELAEAISPCVLWIDELEKAFAGTNEGGSEVTTRLFGAILTWLQDKTKPVFVLATANKIDKLPPELLRKGRFDEVFYVPLPNKDERRKIFEIHINKRNKRRKQDLTKIDIGRLVEATNDYTGADIEGVVNESVENAFVDSKETLTTEDILECIKYTKPLSETMKEELDKMKAEYRKRKLKPACEGVSYD